MVAVAEESKEKGRKTVPFNQGCGSKQQLNILAWNDGILSYLWQWKNHHFAC